MIHVLWRVAIAAFCYVAFIYIMPLFLTVLEISASAPLAMALASLRGSSPGTKSSDRMVQTSIWRRFMKACRLQSATRVPS